LTLTFHCPDLPKGGFVVTTTHGRVCVSTAPGASLTIAVKYCQGTVVADQSPALRGTFHADTRGNYEWNWRPQAPHALCAQGSLYTSGSAAVTARRLGQEVSATAIFAYA
jgi:hypothetical protein